jgi:hypothetical protein
MSTTSDTAELKQQLQATETQVAELTRSYPDLPPDEQRECMLKLEATMKQLSQIRHDLAEAEKRESGAFTVQFLGLERFQDAGFVLDLDKYFHHYQANQRPDRPTRLPDNFTVAVERNHIADMTGHLKPTTEYFMHFSKNEDVCYVLGLKAITLPLINANGHSCATIQFTKPTRDAATRTLWRTIGEQIERIRAIDAELEKMGAVRECGVPRLPDTVIDRTYFLDPKCMPEWKRVRAAGRSLDHQAFAVLRHRTPVDAAQLSVRIKGLYDEQCDLLIQLREHQLAGLRFCF